MTAPQTSGSRMAVVIVVLGLALLVSSAIFALREFNLGGRLAPAILLLGFAAFIGMHIFDAWKSYPASTIVRWIIVSNIVFFSGIVVAIGAMIFELSRPLGASITTPSGDMMTVAVVGMMITAAATMVRFNLLVFGPDTDKNSTRRKPHG